MSLTHLNSLVLQLGDRQRVHACLWLVKINFNSSCFWCSSVAKSHNFSSTATLPSAATCKAFCPFSFCASKNFYFISFGFPFCLAKSHISSNIFTMPLSFARKHVVRPSCSWSSNNIFFILPELSLISFVKSKIFLTSLSFHFLLPVAKQFFYTYPWLTTWHFLAHLRLFVLPHMKQIIIRYLYLLCCTANCQTNLPFRCSSKKNFCFNFSRFICVL